MITRVRVKNYRSLGDVDVPLESLTVFVGPNGSGKSNLIDAIRFVRDAIKDGLDNALSERGGIEAVRRWSGDSELFEVSIHLDIETHDFSASYSFILESLDPKSYRVKSEKIWVEPSPENKILPSVNWVLHEKSHPGFRGTQLFLTRFSFSQSESQQKTLAVLQKYLSDLGFYAIQPNTLRVPQKPAYTDVLDEQGNNLAHILQQVVLKRPKVKTHIIGALQHVTEGVEGFSVGELGGYLLPSLHYRIGGTTRVSSMLQESDGTLWLLGLLTALYHDSHQTLIALEEPELHIHPGALGVLSDVFSEVSVTKQLLLTTHSPHLLDRLPVSAFRVVDKQEGISQVGGVRQNQLRAIEEKLFSPSELMSIEGLQREPVYV